MDTFLMVTFKEAKKKIFLITILILIYYLVILITGPS